MCRWPSYSLCMQQVLLLPDFAYNDSFGWTLPQNLTRPDALQLMQSAAQDNQATNSTPEQQQKLPNDLVQQLGPGYNGTLPVRYINSVWVCQQPSAACASQPNSTAQRACLLQAYTQVNPDRAAAAADPGGNYGVQVVLPAVLASVGKHAGLLFVHPCTPVLISFKCFLSDCCMFLGVTVTCK